MCPIPKWRENTRKWMININFTVVFQLLIPFYSYGWHLEVIVWDLFNSILYGPLPSHRILLFFNNVLVLTTQVFDKNWHKIHFGVFRQNVVLYLDCGRSASEPLQPRGPINLNGEISIAKVGNSKRTVPVSFIEFFREIQKKKAFPFNMCVNDHYR